MGSRLIPTVRSCCCLAVRPDPVWVSPLVWLDLTWVLPLFSVHLRVRDVCCVASPPRLVPPVLVWVLPLMWIHLAGSEYDAPIPVHVAGLCVPACWNAHEASSLVGQFKVKRQSSGKPTCLKLSVQFSPQVIGRRAGASIAAIVRHIVKFAAVAPAAALSRALDGCFTLVGMFVFFSGSLRISLADLFRVCLDHSARD